LEIAGEELGFEVRKFDLLRLGVAPAAAERTLEEPRLLGDDIAVDVELLFVVVFTYNDLDQG
jgi:hypothetical protein